MIHVFYLPANGDSVNAVKPAMSLEKHLDYVSCLETDDERIYSGSCDCTVGVWSHSGEDLGFLSGHTDWVFSLALWQEVGDKKTRIISCSRDATARVWDPCRFECLRVIAVGGSRVLSCSIRLGSSIAAFALGNNRIAIVDLAVVDIGKPMLLSGHAGRISGFQFWNRFLISGSIDSSIRIWDVNLGCLVVLRAHKDCVNGIYIDNDQLYTASDDNTLRIWDLKELNLTKLSASKKNLKRSHLSWSPMNRN